MTIPLILLIDTILVAFCLGLCVGLILVKMLWGVDILKLKIQEERKKYILFFRILLILFFAVQIVMNFFGLLY